jgi:hypothetical protein
MKKLIGFLFLLVPIFALTQTVYYPYTTIPPTIAATSILCNTTGSLAIPLACTSPSISGAYQISGSNVLAVSSGNSVLTAPTTGIVNIGNVTDGIGLQIYDSFLSSGPNVNNVYIQGSGTGQNIAKISSTGTDPRVDLAFDCAGIGPPVCVISMNISSYGPSFLFNGVASAVNYGQFTSSISGSAPILSVNGSDTNIPFGINTKGTGGFTLRSGTNPMFVTTDGGASGSYIEIFNQSSGSPKGPILATVGGPTNTGMAFQTKGTGPFLFYPGSDGLMFQIQNNAQSTTYFSVNTSTNAVAIGTTSTAVTMPGLAASSASTTGTVCWTTATGNLTVDTTTTCLLSDGRHKMNIQPLDAGIAEVMQLKPVSYDLKPNVNPTHLGRQVGLIAQDVIKVDERLASVYQSGPDKGTPSGVRYEQMVALLVEAIQEQQHEIDALKREMISLKH